MKKIIIVCFLSTLYGCALTSPKPAPVEEPAATKTIALTSDFSRSKLIAADFVATITQLPTTNPATTILHTSKPATRFGELLLSALQKAGFDLRIGTQASDFWVAYNATRDEQVSDTGNPIYTFIVAAGEVKLKRSYEVDQYGVRPAGNMFVRGANTDSVVMDDSIFSIREPKPAIEVVPEPTLADFNDGDVLVDAVPTVKPFVKTRKVVPAAPEKSLRQRELAASVAALAPLKNKSSPGDYSEFTNMYETDESRYKDVFENYTVLDTNVLVFPNDSLVLGMQNKATVWQTANTFNPETDLMSIIGCSHGKTKLKNGNAYLANGRATRVKEEFMAAGLDTQFVLEEGCWANVHFAKMPARGVLVQHKRLTSLN